MDSFEAIGTRRESVVVTLHEHELKRILSKAYTFDQLVEELTSRLETELLIDIVCSDEGKRKSSRYRESAFKYVKNKYKICDKRKAEQGIYLVEKDAEWDYHNDTYRDRDIRRLTPEETEEYDKIQSLRSLIDMMRHK